ncbi:MAG: dihydrolipoyl dehydrogenase, partial [Burkholderiales bacterium]
MKALHVDVAVIGSGTAGLVAYRAAKAGGATVAIVESGAYGSTCARVGCMPSKLLIAASEAAHAAQAAQGFGVHVDGIRVNGREVMARVRSERDRFVNFVVRDTERFPQSDRIRGHARFVDDHTLIIDDHTRIVAKSVVIATGSRVSYPESFKKLGDRLIVNDDVFDWQDLPESVAVIGPGVIGLELGQALHRLGVHVVVLGRGGRVGPIADPEIRAYSIAAFNQEFTVEPDAHITDMRREDNRVLIRRATADGAEKTEYFDHVLAATGRTPNIAGLDIEKTSVELDSNGIPLFDSETAQTRGAGGRSSIFIAGDASN